MLAAAVCTRILSAAGSPVFTSTTTPSPAANDRAAGTGSGYSPQTKRGTSAGVRAADSATAALQISS